jgi:hypothetical protein
MYSKNLNKLNIKNNNKNINNKNINNKNINNITNEETHEQQVMRVVREMVVSGELVKSVDENGEPLYSLPEKAKPMDEIFRKRSAAAHKAWATRRLLEAGHTNTAKPKMKKACGVKHKPCKAATTAELPGYSVIFTSFVEYIQVWSHDKSALHTR